MLCPSGGPQPLTAVDHTPVRPLSAEPCLSVAAMEWVWYQIQMIFCGSTGYKAPKSSTSLAIRLPPEGLITEMIVAHFIYHKSSLLACSLTCRSWYIVVLPHIHHTLVTESTSWCLYPKFPWPMPPSSEKVAARLFAAYFAYLRLFQIICHRAIKIR